MRTPNYDSLPESLRGGMQRYIEEGILPGEFLQAVLSNDLLEAFSRADAHNTLLMPKIVAFVYCEMPGTSHGSPEAMRDWIKRFVK
jgi:hypothetical protein